jgi:hypothetical protein
VRKFPEAEGEKCSRLIDPQRRLYIEVPALAHPSRVHLDTRATRSKPK